MIHDEITTLRRRIADAERAIDQIDCTDIGEARELIGVTTTVGTYPTAAARFYAVKIGTPSGTESEGSTGTITAGTAVFYAMNVGASIPPAGTSVIITQVDGKWVFRYG